MPTISVYVQGWCIGGACRYDHQENDRDLFPCFLCSWLTIQLEFESWTGRHVSDGERWHVAWFTANFYLTLVPPFCIIFLTTTLVPWIAYTCAWMEGSGFCRERQGGEMASCMFFRQSSGPPTPYFQVHLFSKVLGSSGSEQTKLIPKLIIITSIII